MKNNNLFKFLLLTLYLLGCKPSKSNPDKPIMLSAGVNNAAIEATLGTDFNSYWFTGKAELNSYQYEINRYDEARKGQMVFVFVTEDLSKSKQVKLDAPEKAGNDRVPVLKLNTIQRFQTGIYDYSMMSSIFTPIDIKKMPQSLKSTTTVQDWCGHVFTQLNHVEKGGYDVHQYSYFETEGDKSFFTEGVLLEDDVFTRLRIDPASLPSTVKMIPNLTFSRIRHKPVAAFTANITFKTVKEDSNRICSIHYPDLKRRLDVVYEPHFPYKIRGFSEYDNEKCMSRATLIKTMLSDYWAKHDNKSAYLHEALGL